MEKTVFICIHCHSHWTCNFQTNPSYIVDGWLYIPGPMMFLMIGVLHPRFFSPIISLAKYPVDSSNLCWTTPRLISHICLTIHDPRDQSWFICVSPNLLTIINDQHLPKVHYWSRYIQFSAAYVDIPLLDLDRNHPIIVLVIDTLYPIYTPFISQVTIRDHTTLCVGYRWSLVKSAIIVVYPHQTWLENLPR